MTAPLTATLFNDPACPWAYSESPALRVLEWRYGDQLRWRLVLIGLSEDTSFAEANGYTPLTGSLGRQRFRDLYGMPFSVAPKARLSASSRACRAVVAARLQRPGSEFDVFRAVQLANFNTGLLLDDDEHLREAIRAVPGVDADQIVKLIDSDEVREAYDRDRAETRTAEGSATELQGKSRNTDGLVRYTAPSVVFEAADGRRLEAGGFQPVEAYDVLVANLAPDLTRRGPPEDPAPLLEWFPSGLTTAEVAALMVDGNDAPDRAAAETALLGLIGAGRARRRPLGDDALWLPA
jgi:predicted DsbA family dithiol-disulfide isomerase